MARVINAFKQFFDDAGNPLVDGFLKFTESGTNNTDKNTYADINETIPNANPVPLDGAGRCPNVFGPGSYRIVSYDSNMQQIQQFDPVSGIFETGAFSEWDARTVYSVGNIIIYNGLYYRSNTNLNEGNIPATSPTHWTEFQLADIYETVAAMIAGNPEVGNFVTTKGYYAAGDNGNATYLIKTASDFGSVPDEYGDHTLDDGNIAVIQISDAADIRQYGARGDGSTDDTLSAEAAFAKKSVIVPSGTYILDRADLISDLYIKGVGVESTLKLKDSSNNFLLYGNNVTNVRISNLKLDGNSANNLTIGTGIRIEGASLDITIDNCDITDFRDAGAGFNGTGQRCTVFNCRIYSNVTDGISTTGTTELLISNNKVHNNGDSGIEIGLGSDNSTIIGNIVHDNTGVGIIVSGSGGSLTDINITGNTSRDNGSHGIQGNVVTRYNVSANICHGNGISGIDSFGCTFATITGNISYNNTIRGIEIDSAAYYNTVTGNTVYQNKQEGISVFRSPTTIISSNQVLENSTSSAGTYHGIRLWDTAATLPSANCRIIGNNISDDRGGSATQGYGISLEDSPTGTTIIGNKITPNVTGGVNGASGNIDRARDNSGFITQNEGAGTIVSGTTSVVLTHGLDLIPNAGDFSITLANSPTNAPGEIWIDTITATQFTVNCRNDPGASGLALWWDASLY
jgi:parallel beta-helix repeat protein